MCWCAVKKLLTSNTSNHLAFRISTRTLHWNYGGVAGTFWYTASCWSCRHVCPRPIEHDGIVWYRQPFHLAAAAAVNFWYLRHCPSIVSVSHTCLAANNMWFRKVTCICRPRRGWSRSNFAMIFGIRKLRVLGRGYRAALFAWSYV